MVFQVNFRIRVLEADDVLHPDQALGKRHQDFHGKLFHMTCETVDMHLLLKCKEYERDGCCFYEEDCEHTVSIAVCMVHILLGCFLSMLLHIGTSWRLLYRESISPVRDSMDIFLCG
ncbi:uncharacterized protein [Acropora muricata]|uniref:uncharacterized protein isoform X2 n=1 Tax=Acropora muricata TaxID=159855 RepID=UPI0034E5CE66